MIPSLAIFLSGRGSNAAALFEILDELPLRLVVSSKANAWGLARAKRSGLPTLTLDPVIDWDQLHAELCRCGIRTIFLLGFMKIIPESFLRHWRGKIWNLHPSLLPEFPGLQAIEKSFAAGSKMGVSVHEVTPEMDAGPLVYQKLSLKEGHAYDLESAKLLISRDEQRLVRMAVRRF